MGRSRTRPRYEDDDDDGERPRSHYHYQRGGLRTGCGIGAGCVLGGVAAVVGLVVLGVALLVMPGACGKVRDAQDRAREQNQQATGRR